MSIKLYSKSKARELFGVYLKEYGQFEVIHVSTMGLMDKPPYVHETKFIIEIVPDEVYEKYLKEGKDEA